MVTSKFLLVEKNVKFNRVQRFPEKALVLQDECLPKGTYPALISTCPASDNSNWKSLKTEISSLRIC